jgi:hypothetical protein
MAFYSISGHQKRPINSRPKTFRQMSEEERMDCARMLEARFPEIIPKNDEREFRRYVLTLSETDPQWRQVFEFARRAFPELFYPGRTPSPEAVSRTFRRIHEKKEQAGE